MRRRIVIDHRFCGPPASGNGGYVCGQVAGGIDGAAEVTLQRPPPLDTPLVLESTNNSDIRLSDGSGTIADARPSALTLTAPYRPSFAEAQTAMRNYTGFRHHFYPGCFVCGPDRRNGDGLRIFAGSVPGRKCVAAPWVPHQSLADPSGMVKTEFIWAALDCPGYFAVNQDRHRCMLLGRLSAVITGSVKTGDRFIVVGWHIGSDGRKHTAGTALYTQSGRHCGTAEAIWIEVAPPE